MNWGIEVLQTSALPLGYVAISSEPCFCKPAGKARTCVSRLVPSVARNYLVRMEQELERKTRFELATLALARRCSTAELLPLKWCLRAESNCRHEDFQSSALPTELPRRNGDPERI